MRDVRSHDALTSFSPFPKAIAVNQAWAGHPGDLLAQSSDTVVLLHCVPSESPSTVEASCSREPARACAYRPLRALFPRAVWAGDGNCTLPTWQQLAKPLPQGAAAVVVADHGFGVVATSVNLTAVPGLACAAGGGSCSVRDVHAHADLGRFTGFFPVASLASHDSVFIVVSA